MSALPTTRLGIDGMCVVVRLDLTWADSLGRGGGSISESSKIGITSASGGRRRSWKVGLL